MKRFALFVTVVAAMVGLLSGSAFGQTVSVLTSGIRVGGGLQDGAFTVRLSTAAHGGVTVRIQSSSAALFTVGATPAAPGTEFIDRFIPNGQTDTSFYVNGVVGATGMGTVSATAPGFTGDSDPVTIVAPVFRFLSALTGLNQFTLDTVVVVQIGVPNVAGTAFAGGQNLAQGPALSVMLSNSNAAVAQLVTSSGGAQNATVFITPGNSQTGTSLGTGGVFIDPIAAGNTTLTATVAGFTAFPSDSTRNVTIAGPTLTFLSLPPRLGSGLQDGVFTARLSGGAHGGVTVRVQSSDASRLLIAPSSGTVVGSTFLDIPVANGQTDAGFYVQALEGVTGTVSVTATTPGVPMASGNVDVVTPAIQYLGPPTSISALASNALIRAQVGIPNVAGTAFGTAQPVRAGSSVMVTMNNSNSGVARLDTLALVGQSVTAVIAANTNITPNSRAAGGVEFDPLGVGMTTLTVSAPGFTPFPAVGNTVTVTPGSLVFLSTPTRLGSGFQDGGFTARLSGSSHGGTTIRLTSADPTRLRVSPNTTTPGSAFIDVAVANGSTDAQFYVEGQDGVTGTVALTASCPLTPDVMTNVDVVPPALRLLDLGGTISAVASNALVRAQIGVLNAAGTAFIGGQVVRPGSSITVTFSNSNPAVAQLVTQSLTGQSVTAVVPALASITPTTLSMGAAFFDPLGTGSTTVTASAPGFTLFPASGLAVTVTPGTMQLLSVPTNLGAGLQDGAVTARLSGSSHGGTTIRIESADPARMRIAPNATTAGSAFIDVPVANGSTDAQFIVQGVAGATPGMVNLTATSPLATSVNAPVNIVQPVYKVIDLPTNLFSTGANMNFRVQVGLPNQFGTDLSPAQQVAGGSTLIFTVNNSNPAGAQLVTTAGSGQMRMLSIAGGSTISPSGLPMGGIALDPLGTGDTVISCTIPGFGTVSNSNPLVAVRCPGDADLDGVVALGDIAVLVQNWTFSVVPGTQGDLSFNGTVGLEDIAIIISNWTLVCP